VTQRDASFILETISDSVHVASSASVNAGTHTLILFNVNGVERSRFWLAGDGHIHVGGGNPSVDQGPLVTSTVTQFNISSNDSTVFVSPLELQMSGNHAVNMSIAATMFNRVIP
jgi:hypothetical protein